ncbi:YhcN/YlaJ family sporulation lipoprotein [Alkalibacillus almallahensis]|uniref:YhcN/YlaJ family sporulation lipoprotein n=1 Tax=Alkalibacillus almallahensis TaxID=1379154 RepID=UPI0014224AFB|nr:YhcN/YlaJ family sporulation lipoprotein [Alkalibacillus almallahensis]NIK11254.1 hypothetical protein [Alkalibacillus almallahensis]
MFKSIVIILVTFVLVSGCTFVNPEREANRTQDDHTMESQGDAELTPEQQIRLNMYENPHEYFNEKQIEDTLDNSDGKPYVSKEVTERKEMERKLYEEVMHLDEIKQAGISVQEKHIYVSVQLTSRTTEEEAVTEVKKVVEDITDRTDVSVYVNREFHNRIEDRKE